MPHVQNYMPNVRPPPLTHTRASRTSYTLPGIPSSMLFGRVIGVPFKYAVVNGHLAKAKHPSHAHCDRPDAADGPWCPRCPKCRRPHVLKASGAEGPRCATEHPVELWQRLPFIASINIIFHPHVVRDRHVGATAVPIALHGCMLLP